MGAVDTLPEDPDLAQTCNLRKRLSKPVESPPLRRTPMISRRLFCGAIPAISLSLATRPLLAQTSQPSALPSHGRYDYSSIKSRKPYRWPNGASLAVYVALNLEHFAFGEGLGAELAPGGPQPDILNFAWRDYGNRVG